MHTDLGYITHLARESARFGEAIGEAAPDAPVPSCPDWTADDLLWHLGRVQCSWAMIIRDRVTGPQADSLMPERPAGRAGLQAFYQRASRDLGQVLAAAAPETPADLDCWLWHRPAVARVDRCGGTEVLSDFEAAIAPGIS
jgi:hypothetical protein